MIRSAKVYDAALMFGHLHEFTESGNSVQSQPFYVARNTPRTREILKQGDVSVEYVSSRTRSRLGDRVVCNDVVVAREKGAGLGAVENMISRVTRD